MIDCDKYIVRPDLGRGWPDRVEPALLIAGGTHESFVDYSRYNYGIQRIAINNRRIFENELEAAACLAAGPPSISHLYSLISPGDYVAWKGPCGIRTGMLVGYYGGGAYFRVQVGDSAGYWNEENIKPAECILLWVA
jgi:hypothetical protein